MRAHAPECGTTSGRLFVAYVLPFGDVIIKGRLLVLFCLPRMAEEERDSATPKSCNKRIKEEKNKKKRLLNEKEEVYKERSATNGNSISNEASAENGRKNRKKCLLMEARKEEATQEVNREIFPVEEEQEVNRTGMLVEQNGELDGENADSRKSKKTKRLLKEAGAADKRGVCYLSRIPPHMDPVKLRQILSQYGEIQRIYLTPESKHSVKFRRKFLVFAFFISLHFFFCTSLNFDILQILLLNFIVSELVSFNSKYFQKGRCD